MASVSRSSLTNEEVPQVRERLFRAIECSKAEKKGTYGSFLTPQVVEIIHWPELRPKMNLDFIVPTMEPSVEPGPSISQEVPLIEDLLSCFLGVSGQFIVPEPLEEPWAVRTFTINNRIDLKLAELAKKCLVMASDFSMVMRFIQDNRKLSVGRVNQALAAAMNNVIRSYKLFILELEKMHHKSLINLHNLWFSIQPVNHPLQTLSLLAKHIAVNRLRGADTLNYLLDYTSSLMDMTKEHEICVFLVEQAAAPFMVSVQKWIFNGDIYDPFDEFMIVGNPKVQLSKKRFPDEYWSKSYQIRKSCTPSFLKLVETTILNAGKYLNVIKDCLDADWNVKRAAEEELKYTYKGTEFLDAIRRAYSHSSKYLLSLMVDEYSIIERIKSVKRYLLLQQEDFVVQLFDSCEEELNQPVANLIPTRLAALIDMAVRLPSTLDDEFRDDIIMSLRPNHLMHQVLKLHKKQEYEEYLKQYSESTLTGLQAFALSVNSTWPVTLVFNVTVISSYQLIFRHLFYCKYIERLLFRVWQMDKSVRALPFSQTTCFSKAFALRHKMMYFIRSMVLYMMEEAVLPNWNDFIQAVETVESIDSLYDVHWTFLKNCMYDCLLTAPDLIILFQNLICTCQEFCDFVISLGSILDLENHAVYTETIEKLDSQFQEQLISFFNSIIETSSFDANNKLWNILLRCNYNNYFEDFLHIPTAVATYDDPNTLVI
ncbi:gamma-tubulin complex component 2 [Halyomorpha halys]|uniref:gamma-tubulin complex component 2 n=1 Tax=Halyomorpha halys TaxID=286706 RepID=UPI0006D4FAF1|nr:gamma-tubulin complex component 2 [Halyomorpha halys]